MQARAPCRVQWVTRPEDMHGLVEKLSAAGAILVARSGYDASTEDLDAVADADTGRLSIAEFKLDRDELERQVVDMVKRLTKGETLLVDLTGQRLKVQVLPVAGERRVIVRNTDGVHRPPRACGGSRLSEASWLSHQISREGNA